MGKINPYPNRDSMNVDETISFLNSLLRVDHQAVEKLLECRVPCNDCMANHPSVQVQADPSGGNPTVGFLGVLNGIFGADEEGWGQIAVVVDDEDGHIQHFFRTSSIQRNWGPCLY